MLEGDHAFVNAVAVVCEDECIRHRKPFFNRNEAANWAEWGHCCTRRHAYNIVRVEVVLVSDVELGSFTAVDADGETFQLSVGHCPEAFGIRKGNGWWTVVRSCYGQPEGGDAHWVKPELAERALGLYLQGARFPIRSWHPALGAA